MRDIIPGRVDPTTARHINDIEDRAVACEVCGRRGTTLTPCSDIGTAKRAGFHCQNSDGSFACQVGCDEDREE